MFEGEPYPGMGWLALESSISVKPPWHRTRMTTCKRCDGKIDWKKVNGRWVCFNDETQIEHWDTCKKLEWRKVIGTGKRFDDENGGGYITPSGRRFDRQSSGVIIGPLYKPSGNCVECCVPWEICTWPCPDSLTAEEVS